jgi:hypothetical protein
VSFNNALVKPLFDLLRAAPNVYGFDEYYGKTQKLKTVQY